jgi:phenylalanyl-tRNA synthetase beta chain
MSEASARMERRVDPAGCAAAIDRATALMAELAGGKVAPGIVDNYPLPAIPRELTLRISRLHAILGTPVAAEQTADILRRLGCEVTPEGEDFHVLVPTFRPDLYREIDLIEEVLRVYGMERVEATLPAGRERIGELTREQRWHERVAATLRGCGLNETMTYSFADPSDLGRLGDELAEGEVLCELLNPMSQEQAVLRRTILPGLLRSVSYNQRRGVPDVHLYEIGATFRAASGRKQPKEKILVAGVLAGSWHRPSWNEKAQPLGFFDGKGVIEELLRELGLEKVRFKAAERPFLQPGRSAEIEIGGQVVGWLGEVHPLVAANFDATAPITAFELELAPLVRGAKDVKPFHELPRFPAVELDIALVLPEDVTAERVEQAVRSAGGKLLESVRIFDVYRGPGVEAGKKSIALALTYRSAERTLTAEEVEATHERLVRKVSGAVGATLRG